MDDEVELSVEFTADEMNQIEEAARKAGVSVSDYVLDRALRGTVLTVYEGGRQHSPEVLRFAACIGDILRELDGKLNAEERAVSGFDAIKAELEDLARKHGLPPFSPDEK
jgi:hypothetical protein